MRAFQIFLVIIALAAVAVAGWALGSRGGYGQPGTDPVAAEAPSPPARQDSGGQGRGDDHPSATIEHGSQAASRPEIQGIWTVPATLHVGGALHLPPGPARVTFRFDIDHATRAQFWLAHGTQVDKTAIWLGEDSYTANGWSVGMRYGDDGFTDNLIIRATGPGGTAEEFVGVTNNGGA
jgi:hypothetical protein